jgi:hypothetical protein
MGHTILAERGCHKKIVFSDESTFSINGVVASQHCREWAERNPHFTISNRRQYICILKKYHVPWDLLGPIF